MNDEKEECSHSGTTLMLTKSGAKRVCVLCGKILEDLKDGVIIEKVVLPVPDVEKTL